MPRIAKIPRYNVLSFRVSEDELKTIKGSLGACETIGDLLRAAALEKAALRQENLNKVLAAWQ